MTFFVKQGAPRVDLLAKTSRASPLFHLAKLLRASCHTWLWVPLI